MKDKKINIIVLTEAGKEIKTTRSLELDEGKALMLARFDHDYAGWTCFVEEEGRPATIEGVKARR